MTDFLKSVDISLELFLDSLIKSEALDLLEADAELEDGIIPGSTPTLIPLIYCMLQAVTEIGI